MAMNLSAASPIAGAGRPRFAARSMKVARSISRLSSWPSNSASFTPFEADAVSNMVVLLAVGSRLSPDPCNWQVDVRPLVCNDIYPWISANDDERRSPRGDIRLDLDPLDLLRALAGVANIGLGTRS